MYTKCPSCLLVMSHRLSIKRWWTSVIGYHEVCYLHMYLCIMYMYIYTATDAKTFTAMKSEKQQRYGMPP
jgi:hypothetical protein